MFAGFSSAAMDSATVLTTRCRGATLVKDYRAVHKVLIVRCAVGPTGQFEMGRVGSASFPSRGAVLNLECSWLLPFS